MRQCSAITRAGGRCQRIATEGYEWCPSHDPNRAEARRQAASKGGKKGGRGRTGPANAREVQGQIRTVIANVLKGAIDKSTAAVVFMGFNTLLRAIEVERKLKEAEEFEERLDALEQTAGNHTNGKERAWVG